MNEDKKVRQKNIAIFASGSGSNAENIYQYFKCNEAVKVKYLVCNNPEAFVLHRFENTGVEIIQIKKSDLAAIPLLDRLKEIDLIVLAGFLLLIPLEMVQSFPNKIINIHPALLPLYGGKGMYGDNIHKAVIKNDETEHGITIHYVNEEFDKGEIIFQSRFKIEQEDTLESIKDKIHQLEMEFYPKVIEEVLFNYI